MKFLRGIAYTIIAFCMAGVATIVIYAAKNDGKTVQLVDESVPKEVVIEGGEVTISDVLDAAGVIISDAKDEVVGAITAPIQTQGTKTTDVSENNSGEISYVEIVRLQEREALDEQKALVKESNEKNGIVTSTSTSTSAKEENTKEYNYVVNKTTKLIHRKGCLLEPNGDNAIYYEKLSDAISAGYKEKCTVCSP